MKTKKLVTLILALVMLLGISACRSKKKEPAPSPEPEISQSTDHKETATPKPEEEPEAPKESTAPKDESSAAPTTEPAETPAPTVEPSAEPTPAPAPTPEEPSPVPELSINDVITSVQYDVELPNVQTSALSSELYPSYLFIDYIEGSEALTSDALIGSIAHSLVVLKLPEGVDSAATADTIRANADPRKWICVEAEKVQVVSSGRYVMLVMSDTVTVDAIVANFNYLMSQQA